MRSHSGWNLNTLISKKVWTAGWRRLFRKQFSKCLNVGLSLTSILARREQIYALIESVCRHAPNSGWMVGKLHLYSPELEPDIVLTQRTPPVWMRLCTPFVDRRR